MDKAKAIQNAAIVAVPGFASDISVAKFEAELASCGYRVVPTNAPTLHSGPRDAGKDEPDAS